MIRTVHEHLPNLLRCIKFLIVVFISLVIAQDNLTNHPDSAQVDLDKLKEKFGLLSNPHLTAELFCELVEIVRSESLCYVDDERNLQTVRLRDYRLGEGLLKNWLPEIPCSVGLRL